MWPLRSASSPGQRWRSSAQIDANVLAMATSVAEASVEAADDEDDDDF